MTSTNIYSSKSDVAYAELRRQILSGTLEPGSRLAQYELAESLNMSITPLREAIRKLSSEGLLDLDTHRNVHVARIDATEARQLFEVRQLLDPPAVEMAAARRTDDDIGAMQRAAEHLLPVTRQWGDKALTAHREFHRAVYLASHNEMLTRLLDDLWDKSDRYRRVGMELLPGDEPRARDLDEHHLMMNLVIVGDGVRAAQLMHGHITRSLTPAAIGALEEREAAHTPRVGMTRR
jgi:DNA-binding GntR family transcriptional regulator